jgi:hypothetical protein
VAAGDAEAVTTKELRSLLRILRKSTKTPAPVIVRRTEVKGDVAIVCDYYRGKKLSHYRLNIRKGISRLLVLDCLRHEWAHILSWEDDVHGRRWGKAYSKVYQATL